MNKTDSSPPKRYAVIWLGLLVGAGFYVADIIIDVFVFEHGTLAEEILRPSYHEMWMRMSVLVVAVAFAIYVQILLGREHAASKRAQTAETFLNSVIDNIPDMVFIKDASELRFIRVNHAGEKLLGLTNRELAGKNDFDFFPASQADFFTRNDREALESGTRVDILEEEIDTATLGKRWLHTKKVPILDDNGQPAYLLGISEDITETREAESRQKKTEARLQTLFDSAAEFIFVINPDGEVIKANRYVYQHSGYAADEVTGSNIKEFFTEASKDICDCNFPGLRERGYNRAEVEFVCKDGRILDMECSATAVPDEDGNFTTFLIIQRDVTDQKRAQKERQRQQEEMAHVMRLSTMGEMASGMAHELNQPLTALVSYCGTAVKLARDIPTLPEGYLETLERASEQAHRAGDVIKHLREFVSKGSNNITRVVLNDLVQDVIGFISWELRNNDIQLAFLPGSPACAVRIDKVQIEQVLINLIRNSIEAIRDAGMTNGRVDITTRPATDDSIEVCVSDNGPGIDPTIATSLFEPYQTSKENGMGMGLSISRSIVEAHNGKLWAELQRPQGASFCMNIPGCN